MLKSDHTLRLKDKTSITVGKFEGLHQGHCSLIKAAIDHAQNNKLRSAMLSFVPHPMQVLHDKDYKPLFTANERDYLIEMTDIDYRINFPFDEYVAKMSPRDFCEMLKNQFNCKALLVGEDFRFGHNQAGTQLILQNLGRELGIEIITIPNARQNGAKISTSRIRMHLAKAEIQEANKLSGKPFFILGTVEKGRQLGRTIGFPTANIYPHPNKLLPPNGVYASKVLTLHQKDSFKMLTALGIGVTSIGTNPTIAICQNHRVETHIFNFNNDIYEKDIIVELHAFIRPERTFKGLEELKQQIAKDAREAHYLL